MLSALDMLKRIIKLSIHLHWAPETVHTRTDSAYLYGTGGSMHAVWVRLCSRHKLKSQRLQHYGLHFPQEVILESFCTKAHTMLASGPDLPHLRSSPSDTALLQLPLVGFTCIPLSAFLLQSAPPNDVCIKKNIFFFHTESSFSAGKSCRLLFQKSGRWLVLWGGCCFLR